MNGKPSARLAWTSGSSPAGSSVSFEMIRFEAMPATASRCLTAGRSAAGPVARGGSQRPSYNVKHYHGAIETRYGPGDRRASSGARFAEGKNESQMTTPKTERDIDPQGCSIRELGDTTPLPSNEAKEASATTRDGPERAFRSDHNWITFQETLSVGFESPTNSIVDHAVPGLCTFGKDLPNSALGDALKVVSCHLGGEEEEQRQHQ